MANWGTAAPFSLTRSQATRQRVIRDNTEMLRSNRYCEHVASRDFQLQTI